MIQKHILTLTILVDTAECDMPDLRACSLADLGWLIDEGPGIGQLSTESIDEIDPDDLHDELIALGNDGGFFEEMRASADQVATG